MKKLVFLTMVFGLMLVSSGSISAQERPGKLEPNCAGKLPKVGMRVQFKIKDSKKGEAIIVHREKSDRPWAALCTLIIDVDSAFIKRAGDNDYYFATINRVNQPFEVLQTGYLVKWQPMMEGDIFIFTTADGKKEVGRLQTKLDNPERTPR